MLKMLHEESSMQGSELWLRSDQNNLPTGRCFASCLMREEGRNSENKRMESRKYRAGLVNSRSGVAQEDV